MIRERNPVGSDDRPRAYGTLMKWGPAIFLYFLMVLVFQASLYLVAPKSRRSSCTPRTFAQTDHWVTYTQEYIYCFQSDSGFTVATLEDFESSYADTDPLLHPVTIAEFQWIHRGSVYNKYSLLSVGDHSRRLQFSARTGSQGEYQEVPESNLAQLQQRLAGATMRARYLQPGNNGLSIPIIDVPMSFAKLLVHAALILSSIKLAIRFENLFVWKSKLDNRQAAGLCIHCSYDCNDLPSPTCPECGQPYTAFPV